MAKNKYKDLLGIAADPSSFYGASKFERDKIRFRSSIARDRFPAGYDKYRMGVVARSAAAKKAEPEQPVAPVPEPETKPQPEPQTGFDSSNVLPGQVDDTLAKDTPQADSGYQPPSVEDTFSTQIAEMQKAFTQSMQQQMQNFQQMQMQQSDRMAALQQQMQQSMQQSMMQAQLAQQRPQVANVQMAESAAGTPMQIARRGVTGAFGRRGMRIKGLNV